MARRRRIWRRSCSRLALSLASSRWRVLLGIGGPSGRTCGGGSRSPRQERADPCGWSLKPCAQNWTGARLARRQGPVDPLAGPSAAPWGAVENQVGPRGGSARLALNSRILSGTDSPMLIAEFPAGSFQTNCYLLATGPGSEALVVDPGQDALPGIDELCARHRLDPVAALGPGLDAVFGSLRFQEPDDVRELADGQVIELAGLRLTVDHTPGHTPGHVTFRTPGTLLAGDLVFAGSIGRVDLPGGSMSQMLASLANRFLTLPDETEVLPGHGGHTTVGRERATNPFLADLVAGDRR